MARWRCEECQQVICPVCRAYGSVCHKCLRNNDEAGLTEAQAYLDFVKNNSSCADSFAKAVRKGTTILEAAQGWQGAVKALR
eukprot:2476783-Heterocapsa_arctica.AAC.1